VVLPLGERSGRASGDMPDARLLPPGEFVDLLPRWGQRCLVPAEGLRLRWHGSAVYPASRARARIHRQVLRLWVAAGLARLSHTFVKQPGRDWPLGDLLRRELPSLHTASARAGIGPAPKTTLRLMDRHGRALAYGKHAHSSHARTLLANEARLLSDLPPGLTPRLIWFGEFSDGDLLVQTVVPGSLYRPSLEMDDAQLNVLRRLERQDEQFEAEQHPFVRRLSTVIGPWRAVLERSVEQLRGSWARVWMHGDFSFFNMHRWQDGCFPFDWECGSADGFPHIDAAHWYALVARMIHHRAPVEARRAIVTLLARHLPPQRMRAAPAIASLFALHHLVTWYPDGPTDAYGEWLAALALAEPQSTKPQPAAAIHLNLWDSSSY
jgi:hypothetical protein